MAIDMVNQNDNDVVNISVGTLLVGAQIGDETAIGQSP
jgi:hypothetical protein